MRQQFKNIVAWNAEQDAPSKVSGRWEYARRVRSLHDLPKLAEVLDAGVIVIMDDLGRLFRPCPDLKTANALLQELKPYGDRLVGLRQVGTLSKMTDKKKALMISGEQNPRYVYGKHRAHSRSRSRSDGSTNKANAASSRSRADTADKNAQALVEIRERLISEGKAPSFRMIVDRANEEGMRTTRGNEWRADTVYRTMKRLEREDG